MLGQQLDWAVAPQADGAAAEAWDLSLVYLLLRHQGRPGQGLAGHGQRTDLIYTWFTGQRILLWSFWPGPF